MKLEWNESQDTKGNHFYAKIEIFGVKIEFQVTYDIWLDVYLSHDSYRSCLLSNRFENAEEAKQVAQYWLYAEIAKLTK